MLRVVGDPVVESGDLQGPLDIRGQLSWRSLRSTLIA